MIANHTSMSKLLSDILEDYNKLYKKKAFIENFLKDNIIGIDEFDDSVEVIDKVISEYNATQRNDYLEWGEEMFQDY
jgi:tubulin gamma